MSMNFIKALELYDKTEGTLNGFPKPVEEPKNLDPEDIIEDIEKDPAGERIEEHIDNNVADGQKQSEKEGKEHGESNL